MTDLDKLLSGITEANRHGEFPMSQAEKIPDDIRKAALLLTDEIAICSFHDMRREIIEQALLAERKLQEQNIANLLEMIAVRNAALERYENNEM